MLGCWRSRRVRARKLRRQKETEDARKQSIRKHMQRTEDGSLPVGIGNLEILTSGKKRFSIEVGANPLNINPDKQVSGLNESADGLEKEPEPAANHRGASETFANRDRQIKRKLSNINDSRKIINILQPKKRAELSPRRIPSYLFNSGGYGKPSESFYERHDVQRVRRRLSNPNQPSNKSNPVVLELQMIPQAPYQTISESADRGRNPDTDSGHSATQSASAHLHIGRQSTSTNVHSVTRSTSTNLHNVTPSTVSVAKHLYKVSHLPETDDVVFRNMSFTRQEEDLHTKKSFPLMTKKFSDPALASLAKSMHRRRTSEDDMKIQKNQLRQRLGKSNFNSWSSGVAASKEKRRKKSRKKGKSNSAPRSKLHTLSEFSQYFNPNENQGTGMRSLRGVKLPLRYEPKHDDNDSMSEQLAYQEMDELERAMSSSPKSKAHRNRHSSSFTEDRSSLKLTTQTATPLILHRSTQHRDVTESPSDIGGPPPFPETVSEPPMRHLPNPVSPRPRSSSMKSISGPSRFDSTMSHSVRFSNTVRYNGGFKEVEKMYKDEQRPSVKGDDAANSFKLGGFKEIDRMYQMEEFQDYGPPPTPPSDVIESSYLPTSQYGGANVHNIQSESHLEVDDISASKISIGGSNVYMISESVLEIDEVSDAAITILPDASLSRDTTLSELPLLPPSSTFHLIQDKYGVRYHPSGGDHGFVIPPEAMSNSGSAETDGSMVNTNSPASFSKVMERIGIQDPSVSPRMDENTQYSSFDRNEQIRTLFEDEPRPRTRVSVLEVSGAKDKVTVDEPEIRAKAAKFRENFKGELAEIRSRLHMANELSRHRLKHTETFVQLFENHEDAHGVEPLNPYISSAGLQFNLNAEIETLEHKIQKMQESHVAEVKALKKHYSEQEPNDW